MDYAYHLDKSSRKYVCPRCGRKSFVLYLDEQNRPLSSEVGKCDRADNCAHHYPPREFFRDHSPIRPRLPRIDLFSWHKYHTAKRPSFIPHEIVEQSCNPRHYVRNSLCRYLTGLFSAIMSLQDIETVFSDYALGTSRLFGGSPVFWQIDPQGKARTGKIMGYDDTGHRVKTPQPQMQWAHIAIKDRLPADFTLCQTFYGAHRQTSENTVYYLFESEKTALITALALKSLSDTLYHSIIPIAAGGCEGFNPTLEAIADKSHKIQILKNRHVVLFPDNGKYAAWRSRAKYLTDFTKSITVSPVAEPSINSRNRPQVETNPSDDLADIIIKYIHQGIDFRELIM